MKSYVLILLAGFFTLTTSGIQAANTNFSPYGDDLLQVIRDIGDRYNVHFTYDREIVENVEVAEYEPETYTNVEEALKGALRNTNLKYVMLEMKYVIIYQDDAEGMKSLEQMVTVLEKIIEQKKEKRTISTIQKLNSTGELTSLRLEKHKLVIYVTGKVTDANGEPLIGVNIQVKGTTQGTATDFDGNFSLDNVDENATLVFSYVGYQTQEVPLNGRTNIQVVMTEDAAMLDEVVVVGYGTQKKESVVGSIVQTSGDVLKQSGGVSTVGQALTGRLPGVITVSGTGMPGEESPEIYIRGQNSWNGGGQPLILVDGIERSMNDININDIENISVLKDASATAVFGVKGANGVILITTKRGRKGKAQLSLSANSTFKTPSKIPQKLQAWDALNVVNDAIVSEVAASEESWADYTPRGIMEKYRNPANQYERERYPDVNWADVVLKDYAQDYNVDLSIRGGTDFAQYFGSLAYQHVGDIFGAEKYDNGRSYTPDFGYDRFNYRSNVDFDITKTTRVSVNLSGYYGVRKTVSGGDMRLVYSSLYGMAPTLFYPIHEDGTYGTDGTGQWDTTNPLMYMSTKGSIRRPRIQLNTDFAIEQKLDFVLEGLKFTGKLAYDNNFQGEGGIKEENPGGRDNVIYKRYLDNGEELYITPPGDNQFDYVLLPWFYDPVDIWAPERRLFYQLSLNYDKTFADLHTLGVLALMNREEYASGSMFPRFREDWVARVTYNYDERYFLDVNGAYNGSEKFGPDYRFELFPSAAVGWMVSNEPFMEPLDWLSTLKLRGSYGVVGDDNVARRWGYITQWTSGGSAYMNNNNPWGGRSPYTYYKEAVIGNPDLHWETSTKMDIGFELGILQNMITVDFDVFDEKQDGIIVSGSERSVPSFLGFSAPDLNIGRTRVKGFELAIGFNKYFANDNKIWSNLAFTQAKDEILYREEPQLKPAHLKTEGFPIGLNKRPINGDIMTNWDDVYSSVRLSNDMQYRRPGYYNMLDFNADGIHDGNTDRAPYGYPIRPQNTWNWSGGVNYNKWSLMVQFYGAFNATKYHGVWDFHKQTPLYFKHLTNYWTKENPDGTNILSDWKGGAATDGYRDYFDASNVRLKNVELAYQFSTAGGAFYKVFVNGNNLWLWSHLPDDRENNTGFESSNRGDYPTFRRFNVGVNINF